MATKNNIRSIRFSDELAELIDRQIGDTFTQKFENLVTKCVWELPNREKQLKDIEEQIKKERERLYRLERATEQLRQLENDLKTTQNIRWLQKSIGIPETGVVDKDTWDALVQLYHIFIVHGPTRVMRVNQ